ncbi:DUF432 domain-containing protein [Pyrococcus yayanosii]|uniref:DUF432 domain-containing protein n=1 Tax=Pyrococcus yayanosii (strain CH1 / JCM 16557) TaxID=529709 RepID=F8AF97_PYRYC|nr:DUF432 domain-containing protein [Pyrococcus yayanosii]AEH24927.1 hypothetical protein PYCH_12490 [Pyrococcus yayanosii CH1]
MFGEHELREGSIELPGETIMLEKEGEFYRYRRGDVERIIVGGEVLRILPAPAVGYGVKLLMIRLAEPLAVPPGGNVEGFLSAPVEVEVKVENLSIDRFSISREKYALYGTLEAGVIARYYKSRFWREEPPDPGVVKLKVINPSNDWRLLERVVFPLSGPMFYSREKAYYPLITVSLKKDVEVVNTGKAPLPGLKAASEERHQLKFMMRW